jgi:hypothetical protein
MKRTLFRKFPKLAAYVVHGDHTVWVIAAACVTGVLLGGAWGVVWCSVR